MLALLAVMVALAAPNAHGDFKIECSVPFDGVGGVAFPWDNKIALSSDICRLNFRIILHRHTNPLRAEIGMMDLLHEAAHIGQWRENTNVFSDPTRAYEHDAECRALAALPGALTALKYRPRFVRAATDIARARVLIEAAPYGGSCLTS